MVALRNRVLIGLQIALLGEVFPTLRALWVEWSAGAIQLRWLVDGPVSDEDKSSISSVETEVQAQFDPGLEVSSVIVSEFDTFAPDGANVACVFARRELDKTPV